MSEASHLSAVSFIDYYRLKKLNDMEGSLPYENITQHNDDILTYAEAYQTISFLLDNVVEILSDKVDLSIDFSSLIVSVLNDKGIVNTREVENIKDSVEKLWDKRINDNKNKGEN